MDFSQIAQFRLPTGGQIGLPAGADNLQTLIQRVIDVIGSIAATGFLIMIIYGGFQFLTASGNQQQAEKGKSTLTNAVIGLVLVAIAYPVVTFVAGVLGIGGFGAGIADGAAGGAATGTTSNPYNYINPLNWATGLRTLINNYWTR